jgi:hypothetical protein
MALPTSLLRLNYQSFRAVPIAPFPDRQVIFRPVIDVRLLRTDKSTQYRVLIDSGADYCIFHADVAEVLGISLTRGKKMIFYGTSGAPQEAYFHEIQIEIAGWPMDLYCGFSKDMQSLPYGILGQSGFFDQFKIEFDYKGKRIELKPKH